MDLEFIKKTMTIELYDGIKSIIEARINDFNNVFKCFSSGHFQEKWRLLREAPNLMLQYLPRRRVIAPFVLMPRCIGDPILNFLCRLRWTFKRLKYRQKVTI